MEEESRPEPARPPQEARVAKALRGAPTTTSPALRPSGPPLVPIQPRVAAEEGRPRDETPTIHVSIGRVEVRAVQPPPKPRRAERPAPSLSLDEYLKRYGRSG
jgi:hypothetical protein